MNEDEAKKNLLTANELRKKLREDPDFLAREITDEKEILRREQAHAEFMQYAAPVYADLAQAGFDITRFSDLYTKPEYANKKTFQCAALILLSWLPHIELLRVKDDMVRTLSIRWAKPMAAAALIKEFEHAPDFEVSGYIWTVGNALSVVADDSVFDDIVKLVTNKRYGRGREMVAVSLGNMKDPRAVDVLIELLKDEQVAGHALLALRKLKAVKAIPYIEPFLTHKKTWVRNEAKRTIAKLMSEENK